MKILTQEVNMLFDYLVKNYGRNEPIFISDIMYNGMTKNNIRQKIMNYAAEVN